MTHFWVNIHHNTLKIKRLESQIIYSFEGNETKGRKQNRQIRLMFHMPEEEET